MEEAAAMPDSTPDSLGFQFVAEPEVDMIAVIAGTGAEQHPAGDNYQ